MAIQESLHPIAGMAPEEGGGGYSPLVGEFVGEIRQQNSYF